MTEPAEALADEMQDAIMHRADALAAAGFMAESLTLTEDQRLFYEIGRNAGYAATLAELWERRRFKGQSDD